MPFASTARRAPRPALLLPVLLLVGTLAGCAGPSPYARVDRPTAVRFQQYVDTLAHPRMEGRGAGEAGLDRARDTLVDHFADLGLEPGFVDDQGRPSYTQAVAIQLGAHAREQTLRLVAGDAETAFEPGVAFNTLGFSGQGRFAGEAVFVGYGIVAPERGYDSYGGLEGEDALAGQVAIAFRYEPVDERGRSRWAGEDGRAGRFSEAASLLRKAEQAAARGAAALLVVDPPALASSGPLRTTAGTDFGDRPATIPVMHIRSSTLHAMLRAAGRDPHAAVDAWQDRANRGVGRPDALNDVRLEGAVRLEYPHATVHNVAGFLPGSGDLARETVVIGAHYDHLGYGEIGSFADPDAGLVLHPGADDNASGTAAVMLLAERAVARHFQSGGGGGGGG
ncbi:MAG: M28 family peptidase, partial [Phycisphaeraceae bacterium]